MTDHDHPDTDLTDPHGEAGALRRENARLKVKLDRREKLLDSVILERTHYRKRAEAAEAALAASRATDPVVKAGSCQPGDMISRAAAIEVSASIADRQCPDNMPHDAYMAYHSGAIDVLDAIRALPAAPVAEAQPTIGGAELDALVARLLDGPSRVYRDIDADKRAADAITALRAQPDWKAMAERLGEALSECPPTSNPAITCSDKLDSIDAWWAHTARAAISDLAKMKDSTK